MRRRHGLRLFLILDGAIFAALLVAYFWVRHSSPAWPHPFHFPSGLMTVAMIMFGGASSFVMAIATRSAEQSDTRMSQRMVALAIVGWFTFLFLLAFEWARLYLTETDAMHSALAPLYFTATGYQALHVVIGMAWMGSVVAKPQEGVLRPLSWFVHFTNAMFVAIAFLLIFPSADLGGF